MRKLSLLSFALLLLCCLGLSLPTQAVRLAPRGGTGAPVQKQYEMYGVSFYNLENLFDTLHDEGKNDYEFLPQGSYRWNAMKYRSKLRNLSRVLSQLCTDRLRPGAAVMGVSEVENRRVLEDLVREPDLAARGLGIVHVEGPDRRGVDCAFLYNPRFFKYESHMLVPFYYEDKDRPGQELLGFRVDARGRVSARSCAPDSLLGPTQYITRGFLVMTGRLGGELFHFIVCHLPSRAAGSFARERGGYQLRRLMEALQEQDRRDPALGGAPGHIVIMGDMNDDPRDPSMSVSLGCKHEQKDCREGDLFNPWWDTLYRVGQGTLLYDGKWNLFDQIVVSSDLLGTDRRTMKLHSHAIFMRPWLFQTEGKYKGSPLRTHAGGVWLDGYSDHLPTQIYLVKERRPAHD